MRIIVEGSELYHVDCPTPSTMKGGIVQASSGRCVDCNLEISKVVMQGALSKRLHNQLGERFQPKGGTGYDVERGDAPRVSNLGNADRSTTVE